MRFSSCVYLSCVWGTGLDQEAEDLQSIVLLIPGEGRQQVNVQPGESEAVEEMSTQVTCFWPCPVNALVSQARISPSPGSSGCEGPFGENE